MVRVLALLAMLCLPMGVQLVAPDRLPPGEAASLAPAPHDLAGLGAWLGDHFGLRRMLIAANGVIQSLLLRSGNERVLMGHDGQLFLRDDDMVQQSTGRLRRPGAIAATADRLAALAGALQRQGVGFLVAIAPNSATIYPELLPGWAQPVEGPTEASLLLAELARRAVPTLDLRPLMLAGKVTGRLYRRLDSHWAPRGALLAYNATAAAMGLAHWLLPPHSLGAAAATDDGDLARLLGLQSVLSEPVEPFALTIAPGFSFRWIATGPLGFEIDLHRPGPAILVIGDSFTGEYFRPLLMQHAGRFIWLESQHCAFDPKLLGQMRPDQVWYMPTERLALCEPPLDPAG